MEKLENRLASLRQALVTLDQAIHQLQKAPDEEWLLTAQDSIIKRFEYTFDLFWKCLKEILAEKYAIHEKSPKPVFHALVKLQLITAVQGESFLGMVDDRNMTVHEYDHDAISQIAQNIRGHYELMVWAIKILTN
jgi:nucleotidyltransferase substrate binding protein (TIGR01987 family)